MRYDAFISYRHTAFDSMVAEKLHKKLERYHIPGKFQKLTGRKRIKRVFRDREELPLSSDLTESIYEALRESEFLILICSPESLASKWVSREVAYFAELRGLDRIITVLIKGEPDEAFPDIIRRRTVETVGDDGRTETKTEEVEPIAADIRAGSVREAMRKLDREFLRVIAAMLRCNYDDLRQRHREYRIRRAMSVLSAALAIALAFLVYALQQKAVIDRQYLSILRSQAKYLSASALQSMNKGDRIGALDTLLSLEPYTGESAQAIVPEQIYGLNQALYSYSHSGTYSSFRPFAACELDAVTTGANAVSPDSSRFFCLDSKGSAYLFSTPDGILLWRKQLSDLCAEGFNNDNVFIDGYFLDDGRLLLMTKHRFCIVDTESAAVERVIDSLSDHEFRQGNPVAVHGSTFAVAYPYDSNIYIYSADRADEAAPYVIELGISPYGTSSKSVSSLAFSPGGQSIAAGTRQYSGEQELHGQQSLIVVDLRSGDKRVIACDSVAAVTFVRDDALAVIQYIKTDDPFSFLSVKFNYSAFLCDLEGNERWRASEMQINSMWDITSLRILPLLDFSVRGEPSDLVAFGIVNSLIVMNTVSNETELQHYFDGQIAGIDRRKDNIFIGLDDGTVYRHFLTSYQRLYSTHSEVRETLFNDSALSVISVNYDSQRIVFSGIVEDARMTPSNISAADVPGGNAIHEADGLSAAYDAQSSVIRIEGKETGDVWEIPVSNKRTPLYSFFRGGRLLLVCSDDQRIGIWDTRSRHMMSEQPLNADGGWNSNDKTEMMADPAGEYFALSFTEGNIYVDSSSGWIFPELAVYYMDSDCTVYPYAVIPYGAVDFEKRTVYSANKAKDTCFEAPFYTYRELIDAAKAVVDERGGK